MAHNLNYAASSLYFTAGCLVWAKRVSRGLKDGSLVLADNSRREANDLLKSVSTPCKENTAPASPRRNRNQSQR